MKKKILAIAVIITMISAYTAIIPSYVKAVEDEDNTSSQTTKVETTEDETEEDEDEEEENGEEDEEEVDEETGEETENDEDDAETTTNNAKATEDDDEEEATEEVEREVIKEINMVDINLSYKIGEAPLVTGNISNDLLGKVWVEYHGWVEHSERQYFYMNSFNMVGDDEYIIKKFEEGIKYNYVFGFEISGEYDEENEEWIDKYEFSKDLVLKINGNKVNATAYLDSYSDDEDAPLTYAHFIIEDVEPSGTTGVVSEEIKAAQNEAATTAVNKLIEMLEAGGEVDGIDENLAEQLLWAKQDGMEITTEVVTPEVSADYVNKDDAAKVAEKLGDSTLAAYFDIGVVIKVNGYELGRVTKLGEKISITLPTPTDLPEVASGYERQYIIIRVHDGVAEEIACTLTDDGIVFETDAFSTYAVAYKDVKKTNNPPTGDNIAIIAGIFALATIGSVATIVIKKRK